MPQPIFAAGTIAYGEGSFPTDTCNVCPILFGGQVVKKLYKAHDDAVYAVNGRIDGNEAVPAATINGITIGLDPPGLRPAKPNPGPLWPEKTQ